jgi:hypothetical protein
MGIYNNLFSYRENNYEITDERPISFDQPPGGTIFRKAVRLGISSTINRPLSKRF